MNVRNVMNGKAMTILGAGVGVSVGGDAVEDIVRDPGNWVGWVKLVLAIVSTVVGALSPDPK